MRLGRLAVAGLTAGVVAGFVVALLLPRRRRTVLDLTAVEIDTVGRAQPESAVTRPARAEANDQPMLHVEPATRPNAGAAPTAVEQP